MFNDRDTLNQFYSQIVVFEFIIVLIYHYSFCRRIVKYNLLHRLQISIFYVFVFLRLHFGTGLIGKHHPVSVSQARIPKPALSSNISPSASHVT